MDAVTKDLGEMKGTLRLQGTLEFRDAAGQIVGTLNLDESSVEVIEGESRDGDQRSERE